MTPHKVLFATLFLAACSEGTVAPAPAMHRPISAMIVRPGVTVRKIVGLVGSSDSVTAINDSDMVVGMRVLGSKSNAFRWTSGTGVQFLQTPTGWHSEAFALNDSGTVVGDVSSAPQQLPARWVKGGGVQEMSLLFPGDSLNGLKVNCIDRGVNASGTSTGYCFDPFYATTYVATWTPLGAVSDVCAPTDCPAAGLANAINSRGVIAGGPALDFPYLKGFVIIPPNTFDTLPKLTPPGSSYGADIAYAINAIGTTAGSAWVSGNCSDPVVWRSFFQKPTDIGDQFCGQANGVDGNNTVIGTLLLQPGIQAFIWTASAGTQALPGLGGTNESSQAVAINNRREILGTITSSGTKYDVIWTY